MNEEHLIQKKVQILNSQWTIFLAPKGYPRLLQAPAVVQFKHKKIYIADSLPKNKFKQFLGTELMQAFCHELGTHSPIIEDLNRKNNEKMVDGIIKSLYPLNIFKNTTEKMKGRE
jgi:hypothetical protein